MIPDTWIEHRREDGERVGWIRIDDDACVPIDLLGRELAPAADWHDAEAALEARGIGFLADRYEWPGADGEPFAVRITQVDPERIVVKLDDFGAVGAPVHPFVVPFPAPEGLRPWPADRPFSWPGRPEADAQRTAAD